MTKWCYSSGQTFVRIEAVYDGEVRALITELPFDGLGSDAEIIAEQICNAHNLELENGENK